MNTPEPLVSIIIPVYNGANFLRLAVDSALAQTYKNTEILIVNDGSKDGGQTAEIAASYGPRVRYFEKENGGVASALNLGLSQMRGDLFSWLSHDDVYEKNKIQTQVEACARHQTFSRTVVFSDFTRIDETGRLLSKTSFADEFSTKQLQQSLFPVLNGLIHGCSLLISRDLFDLAGKFDESRRTTQDYALWNQMFRHARLIFIPEALVQARHHSEQGSHTIPSQRREMVTLWSEIYSQLSVSEMCEMYGSTQEAFKHIRKFQAKHLKLHEIYWLLEKRVAAETASQSLSLSGRIMATGQSLVSSLYYLGLAARHSIRRLLRGR